MQPQTRRNIRKWAYLPYAIYMVCFTLFGWWTMAQQIHWLVPVAFFAASALTCNVVLACLTVSSAAIAGVYGLMLLLPIPWYEATGLALAPLGVLMPFVGLALKISGPPEAPVAVAEDVSNVAPTED